MGFYFHRTIKVGAVNLNLSGSGLGISTGVRGFRVGMNGRGTYVQMGRGGLYYRKQVSWHRLSSRRPLQARPSAQPHPAPAAGTGVVFTQELAQPMRLGQSDATTEEVMAHFKPQAGPAWAVVTTILALLACVYAVWLGLVLLVATLVGAALQLRRRASRILIYDLDGRALQQFEAFVNAFGEFFVANKLWLYEQRAVTTDWKRNAGATNLMKRRTAEVLPSGDPRVRSNISIPCLRSGQDAFYFLPDVMVCRQGTSLSAVRYSDVRFQTAIDIFIEEQGVPSDAQVVGHTWKFVRKDGGPDRRFNNNRQLPKCRYQAVGLVAGTGFERLFSKSRVADPQRLAQLFHAMAAVMNQLSSVGSSASVAPGRP